MKAVCKVSLQCSSIATPEEFRSLREPTLFLVSHPHPSLLGCPIQSSSCFGLGIFVTEKGFRSLLFSSTHFSDLSLVLQVSVPGVIQWALIMHLVLQMKAIDSISQPYTIGAFVKGKTLAYFPCRPVQKTCCDLCFFLCYLCIYLKGRR